MGSKLKIEKDYSGIKSLQRKLTNLAMASVEWGFFEDKRYGSDNNNLPVAQVAYWNEFGAMFNPSRPFFQASLNENRKKYLNMSAKVFEALLCKSSYRAELDAIGKAAVLDVKRSIEEWSSPPNSRGWTAFKRSVGAPTKPLEYTQTMLDSVSYKIVKE